MFFNALVQSLILHQYFHRCFLVGMRVRTAIIAAVYKKVGTRVPVLFWGREDGINHSNLVSQQGKTEEVQ